MDEIYNVTMIYTNESISEEEDVRIAATSLIMYKIGEGINKTYFLFLVPVGVIGNLLSFLVMIQPHNRNNSLSLYIAVLAVTDSMALCAGFTSYLNMVHHIEMPPSHFWYCSIGNGVLFATTMCSTLFILSMTFERCYSIIMPHKAASFNTVKRARITIIVCVVFSTIFSTPHLFISDHEGTQCVPYARFSQTIANRIYYWVSTTINFIGPFVLLLIMNSIIIFTLSQRSNFLMSRSLGQGQSQGQGQMNAVKLKNSEKQIYTILLLVTFAFLILTTPVYAMMFYVSSYDYTATAQDYAGYYVFYNVGQKTYYTNFGVNFFLYVMSGTKFRTDLAQLFSCRKGFSTSGEIVDLSDVKTSTSDI